MGFPTLFAEVRRTLRQVGKLVKWPWECPKMCRRFSASALYI